MTDEELEAINLDIHRKVMGQNCELVDGKWVEYRPWCTDLTGKPFAMEIPDYARVMEPAWRALEHFDCYEFLVNHSEGRYYVCVLDGEPGKPASATADAAPLAICLALLKGAERQAKGKV